MDIRVIFEDENLLVVDKPPHLVVDPADTVKEETLADILINMFKIPLLRGGIVHRLDKETSGVILVAKTQEALDNLQSQFKDRKTKKEYIALVHGVIKESGKVEGNIGRNPGNREKFTVLEDSPRFRLGSTESRRVAGEAGGKEAVTEYVPDGKFQIPNDKLQIIFNDYNKIQMRKLERMSYNQFSLVKCFPLTGRTHQIRVHLKHIGFPIVADEKYVGRKTYRLDHRWCPRLFLHAAKIGFFHPKSGEWMEVESPLPEDLKKVIDVLK